MPGSSLSVADPNIILNTAVASSLEDIYDALKDVPAEELDQEVYKLLKKMLDDHKRILFNGNGYTDAWLEEAKKRGLFNLKSLPDALPQFKAEKNVDLFTKYHIFTESEIDSRYEIKLENYSKTIHIEALTMIDMVKRDFTPALFKYMKAVESELLDKKALLGSVSGYDLRVLKELDACSNAIDEGLAKLEADVKKAEGETDSLAQAEFYHDVILKDMDELRVPVDTAEAKLPSEALPYPTYDQLLFSLR